MPTNDLNLNNVDKAKNLHRIGIDLRDTSESYTKPRLTVGEAKYKTYTKK